MGDRGNVLIKDKWEDGVFLYTHWGGYELPQLVQEVLRRNERWEDSSYLARMVFSRMIRDYVDTTTGFGISTHMPDNEYPVIVLVPAEQRVLYITEDAARQKDISNPLVSWTMEEFISEPDEEILVPFHEN